MLSKNLIAKIGVFTSVTSVISSGVVFAGENSTVQIISEDKEQNDDSKINNNEGTVTTPSAVTLKSITAPNEAVETVLRLDVNIFNGDSWEYGFGESNYVLDLSTTFWAGDGEGKVIYYKINDNGDRIKVYEEDTTSGITHYQLGNLSVGDYKYVAEFVSDDETKWKSCESKENEFKVSKKNLNIKPKEQTIKAGDKLPEIEFEYKGLYPGCTKNGVTYPADDGSVISGLKAKYYKEDGTELTDSSTPGKYKVKIVDSGEAQNYNITTTDGELYINSAYASQTELTLVNDAKNINISDRITVNIPDSILHPENMEGVLYGTSINFTANVKAQNGNIPKGKVVFFNVRDDKWEKLGEKELDSTGKAIFTTDEINVFDNNNNENDVSDPWLKGKEKTIRAVFEPTNNEQFITSSSENKIRLQKAILFIDTKVSNYNPKPGETIDVTLTVKNLDNPECKKGFPIENGKEDVLQIVVYPNGAGLMSFNVIQDKNNPEIYRGEYTIPGYDFYENNGDMMTNFQIYGGLDSSKCFNYTGNTGINTKPDTVEKVIVNFDENGEDTTDNTEEEFKDAKAKALEFISRYKFTKNMNWKDFTDALTKELSSLGITNTGDEATINQDTGEVTATIYLYKGSKVYSFPITAQATNSSTSSSSSSSHKHHGSSSSSGNSSSNNNESSSVSDKGETSIKTDEGVTINNANQENNPKWEKNNDGTYSLIVNEQKAIGWQNVNDKWYFMNSQGTMQKGWMQDKDENWYHLNTDGEMQKGWFNDTNGKWYYLKESGVMEKDWVKDINGKWYYLKDNGEMATGWIQDNDGKWYYLNQDGSMAYNTYVNGYYLGSNGAWIN